MVCLMTRSRRNGGITTCESLWHGVPVVARAGETFAGRHAVTYLQMAGCERWIAEAEAEYIDLAVSLASDAKGLQAVRSTLRDSVAASRLCDGPKFAKQLLPTLQKAWRS